MKAFFIFLFFPLLLAAEEPWGTDSALVWSPKKENCLAKEPPPPKPMLSCMLQRVIRFHQTVLSPVDGPRSHFYPCSSQYMYLAIQRYGALEGFIRGCDRLLRENEEAWVYRWIQRNGEVVKYDPVE